jgi:asparaginyl-tRNA synthetase
MRTKINVLFETPSLIGKELTVCGWVKTLRRQKNISFLEINDGSIFTNLQIIIDSSIGNEELFTKLSVGASVFVDGLLNQSQGKNQSVELIAKKLHVYGTADANSYPLQKKQHSFEFLRTLAHLRPRTNTQGAILRIRNALAFATHTFFQQRNFFYIQTPIITSSDCEGGGELFQVTTLKDPLPRLPDQSVDYSQDFFKKKTYLTVSGQLNLESFACALSDVYTFGPTFRAENSNTSRHLAEFWMIEPEMAFATLEEDMELAQSYLKFTAQYVLNHCPKDMEFFDQFIEKGVIERLRQVIEQPFEQVSYTEAVSILQKAKKSFEFPVKWGIDLQSEHERYLTEEHFKKPVIVTDYPECIKAFYMRRNEDQKTVAAMDILVPKVGEIIGGSQREERLEVIEEKIEKMHLKKEDYWWYLDLRRFGSVPHCGFGVGFERLVLFITGMENIRDVIPFPRFPGHAEF